MTHWPRVRFSSGAWLRATEPDISAAQWDKWLGERITKLTLKLANLITCFKSLKSLNTSNDQYSSSTLNQLSFNVVNYIAFKLWLNFQQNPSQLTPQINSGVTASIISPYSSK